MGIKIGKKAVLTGLSAILGIGSFVVNIISKNEEINEAAKQAAKIVADNASGENK